MKKKLPIIIALVAAVSLFSISALAFTNNQTGYDTLKEALKSAKHFENGTFDVQIQVTDNEQVLVGANVVGKVDHTSKSASGQMVITANNLTKTADFYQQDDTTLMVDVDNDLYYQIDDSQNQGKGHGRNYHENYDTENYKMTASQEAFIDYLAGDLKNQVSLTENADGSKNVTLDLTGENIPVALNLMISAAASEEGMHHRNVQDQHHEMMLDMPFFQGFENLETLMPELKEDVKVTAILVALTLDSENQITGFDSSITLVGKDASGTAHDVTAKLSGKVSDVDETVVDTIDLTGKDVQVIETEKE